MANVDSVFRNALKCHKKGDIKRAEQLCWQVIKAAPAHGSALFLLGNCLLDRSQTEPAVAAFKRADQALPGKESIKLSLGKALIALGRYPDAADCFEQAVSINQRGLEGPENLAKLYLFQQRYKEALALCEQALERYPKSPKLNAVMGQCLWEGFEFTQAEARFRAALCARKGGKGLRWVEENLLFMANYNPGYSPSTVRSLHEEIGGAIARKCTQPLRNRHPNDPDPQRPIRVGYLSPDFKRHPVLIFIASILSYHDPAHIEVYCYGSVASPDVGTQAVKNVVPNYRDVVALSDQQVAEQIAADGIDILVELAGYTEHTRIRVLPFRPAPIQVSFLGYPATTGLPEVDYRLTDELTNPAGSEVFYTEKLARVAGGFTCYMMPPNLPDCGPLPAQRNGYLTFGSLVTLKKVNHQVVALWAQVLKAVPNSRFFLFRDKLSNPLSQALYRRWFEAEGIDPARLKLGWQRPLPKDGEHFSLYQNIDIVLDTFPFSGHTSTCEALAMGVPVLTLVGQEFAQRLSYAVLEMAGLKGFSAQSPEAFVALAQEWSGRIEQLATIRAGLREQVLASRLSDAHTTTRNVEAALRRMWRSWCADQVSSNASP